jgi:hypothetical protein
MPLHLVRAALIVAVPTVVFIGGAAIMTRLSGRAIVTRQLEALPNKADRTPLNSRLHYDQPAVERHWGALNADALAAETRFLEMDLVFPVALGGAFLAVLLLGWATLDRSFNPTWIVLLVAITMLADWTENLTLLGQIEAFARNLAAGTSPAAALSAGRIGLASAATLVKLAGNGTEIVAAVAMTIAVVLRKAG